MNIEAIRHHIKYLPPRLAVADFFAKKVAQAEICDTLTDFDYVEDDLCQRCKECQRADSATQ